MKQRPVRSAARPAGKGFSQNAVRRLSFNFAGLGSLAFTVIVVGGLTLGAFYLYQGPGLPAGRVTPQDDGVYESALASYAGLSAAAGLSSAGIAGPDVLSGAAGNDRPVQDRPVPAGNRTETGSVSVLPEQSEEIPLDLTETFAWSEYLVKRGDSVSAIAARHALSMDAIIASNNISNARQLREGQVLRLPNMDGIPYTVKSGDTLGKIARNQGIPMEAILDANDLESELISAGTMLFLPGARMPSEDLKLALGELFIYPIRGRLTSPYGWRQDPISNVRRFHSALDLAASIGTPVKAAMDGRIESVGFNATYGKYIIMAHGNNYQTMYAHLSLISVEQGASVHQGSKIGEVGNTGYSTGPHLHFAIYKNGRALNPLDFLNSTR
ncbi:MAG: M23 family metallopeptidase [Spirochaetaceae bacterium]|nr:M23 family metallopeptidase [Spirochaetaceae bacterium]